MQGAIQLSELYSRKQWSVPVERGEIANYVRLISPPSSVRRRWPDETLIDSPQHRPSRFPCGHCIWKLADCSVDQIESRGGPIAAGITCTSQKQCLPIAHACLSLSPDKTTFVSPLRRPSYLGLTLCHTAVKTGILATLWSYETLDPSIRLA